MEQINPQTNKKPKQDPWRFEYEGIRTALPLAPHQARVHNGTGVFKHTRSKDALLDYLQDAHEGDINDHLLTEQLFKQHSNKK